MNFDLDLPCLCDLRRTRKRLEVLTRETREGEGLWMRCSECGLALNKSGVSPAAAKTYYNKEYFQTHSYEKDEVLPVRRHFAARLRSIGTRAAFLKKRLCPDSRVFELGAAAGELLYLLKDHVAYCRANEINSLYAAFIRDELRIDATDHDFFELDIAGQFDLIIAVNTIDHMFRAFDAVEKIYRDLNSGGFFYVEVPNDSQALKEFIPESNRLAFRKFMYQRAHYYSFTLDTLSQLLQHIGFKIVDQVNFHDYTLRNFLNWYFTGSPQRKLTDAKDEERFFPGDSGFERRMNELLQDTDRRFKEIICSEQAGETIGLLVRKC